MHSHVIAKILIADEKLEELVLDLFHKRDSAGLKKLVEEDHSIAKMKLFDATPIITVAYDFEMPDLVKFLLDHGADPEEKESGSGKSLVDYLTKSVNREKRMAEYSFVFKYLKSDSVLGTSLRKMILDEDIAGLEALIQADKSVLKINLDGIPLVTAAYLYRVPKAVDLLLKHGADPFETDAEHNSLITYVQNAEEKIHNEYKTILEKHGYRFEQEEETGKDIREDFYYEGFHVINAGLRENRMKEVLSACSKLFARMKKFGFGKLLYGPLIVTSKELESKVFSEAAREYKAIKAGAWYNYQKDLVVINADAFLNSISQNMQLLAHELAHRHWFKFLSASQRQLWSGKYKERGVVIEKAHADYINKLLHDNVPNATDHLGFHYTDWTKFNYGKFLMAVTAKQDKYRLRDILDGIANKGYYRKDEGGNTKTIRRKFIMNQILDENSYGGLMWCTKNIELASAYVKGDITLENLATEPHAMGLKGELQNSKDNGKDFYNWMKENIQRDEKEFPQLYNNVGKMLAEPSSSTEYGRNNSSEDYAEAFGNFIANHPMPVELYNQFARINNLRLAKVKYPSQPDVQDSKGNSQEFS
jgi:hypothetical protein